jgi:hypothetical protein
MMDSVFFFLNKQLLSDPAPPSPGETMKATFGGGGGMLQQLLQK